MALNRFTTSPEAQNKFCKLANLRNESDVEQFFVLPLLKELGYGEDYVETKATISDVEMGKGKNRKKYHPDYICYSDKRHLKPVLIVDAKSRDKSAEEGVSDAQLYTSIIRRRLDEPKPIQYCIGTNADWTIVKHYESDKPRHTLEFKDFQAGNPKFDDLKSNLRRSSLTKALALKEQPFEFTKPEISEVIGIFEACHSIIRRKEGMLPQPAFWEFSKVMFVKLNEDKKLRNDPEIKKLVVAGKPLSQEKISFSLYWIELVGAESNPINTILFKRLRESLELEIIRHTKKRIFKKDEQINLKPETIREIVRLLEHHDLFGIDEDLNGKLFETFLSATMRGKELGQLFTPRTVVKFMTELAELKASPTHVDRVLDACCGTAGFLIEAMETMRKKIRDNPTLNSKKKEDLLSKVRDENLFGIDFGKDPPIARIARINMYLHGDGGSRIYFADALDKQMLVLGDLSPELKSDREELRKLLARDKLKFNVALTNPPFAMSYSRRQADERRILEQYRLSEYVDTKGIRKKRSSLDSSAMFIERYCDLLESKGKLLIVIDESVLNTKTDKSIRDFILDNFLVRAVISLPRETFKRAGVNVKTSILYLEKKESTDEEQPFTFYARSENTGCDPNNAMKIMPHLSDLDGILEKYREYQRTGKL